MIQKKIEKYKILLNTLKENKKLDNNEGYPYDLDIKNTKLYLKDLEEIALNIDDVSITEGELCFNCGQVPAVNEHASLCKGCYDNWSKGKAIETN